MIPVANRPILEYIIEALDAAGVEEVILVVGSNRERVQNYFENGQAFGVRISYVVQEQQLGTGHALLQAEAQLDDSFVVLNGDRIVRAPAITDVWEQHQQTGVSAMGVTRVSEPSRYGVVKLDGDTVIEITEKPLPELATSDLINTGVYALTADIFTTLRQTDTRGEQALTDALAEYVADRQLRAVRYRGVWQDISEPWDLLSMNEVLTDQRGGDISDTATVAPSAVVAETAIVGDGVTIHPQAAVLDGVTLGDNVSIGPGVLLEDSVILSDVTINAGAAMAECIVGANTTVRANTTVEGGTADIVLNGSVYHDVTFGGMLGDNVNVGGNVTIQPGTIVGNNARLGSGTRISGRVDDGQHVTRG
jgi:glucose-1-phosphate thymidylyltransferase